MAAVSSTYTDPSDNFVWWVEGDKLAIATKKGPTLFEKTDSLVLGARSNM